ncbi:UDP-N-acetylglucosamine transferase subunit ALG14 [Anabrus simplex]|uniref:UDP-N-acetylglucosamine transferase subunit ALG14 n=1 Tax=Anabrus simplex TaxID=316456 RepID=UPI0034DD4AA1
MLIYVLSIFVAILCVRFVLLLWKIHNEPNLKREGYDCVKTAIIIGSGGHTSEMLRLTCNLNPKRYDPRIYIMASSDVSSEVKVREVERERNSSYIIIKIPRSRNVNQSYISSIFTTIYSTLAALPIMFYHRPELILCNGPGTCIPICVIAFLMKLLWITNTTIIFVESVCRVKTLSLSGKILLLFADAIFVQWPQLQERYKRTRYIGRLV